MKKKYELCFKWTFLIVISGFAIKGYNVCTLYVDGKRTTACNGGGYDMKGTAFGDWIAVAFADKLLKLKKEFSGLTFHDPNYNPMKAVVPGTKQTVEEREALGLSIGLEAYQSFYRGSNKLPTKTHVVPQLDGAHGFCSMERVLEAIGGKLEYISKDNYIVAIGK